MKEDSQKSLVLEYASLALSVKREDNETAKKRMDEIEAELGIPSEEILAEAERITLNST